MRSTDMNVYELENQANIRGKNKETSKCVTKLYKMYDYSTFTFCTYLSSAMVQQHVSYTSYTTQLSVLWTADDRMWSCRINGARTDNSHVTETYTLA